VYARAGKLFGVPFDVGRLDVTGSPFEVLDGVMMSTNTGAASFTLSRRGDLAFVPGAAFFFDGRGRNTLRLSYSLPGERDIDRGIAQLAQLIREPRT